MSNSQNMISIVICSYNRAQMLPTAIKSLLENTNADGFDFEIIIVDNNSKDNTKEVVKELSRECSNGQLRYVYESRQGLNYARNAGARAAKGSVLAYTDDDVVVDKDWLRNIWSHFKTYDCDALGGRVLPVYPEKTPLWVKDNRDLLCGPVLYYDYGEAIKVYKEEKMMPFVGANMSYKKQALEQCGYFRDDLGAGHGTMGDDTEFFRRMEKAGKVLHYNGKVVIWHPVEEGRMTLKYIAKWNVNYGKYLIAKQDKEYLDKGKYYFGIPQYLIRRFTLNILRLPFMIFSKKVFLEAWVMVFRDYGMIKQYRKDRRS